MRGGGGVHCVIIPVGLAQTKQKRRGEGENETESDGLTLEGERDSSTPVRVCVCAGRVLIVGPVHNNCRPGSASKDREGESFS